MTRLAGGLAAAVALLLQGCAGLDPKENVIFVTKTAIALEVDGTPPELSFGYNRVEGFMGPRYANGAVPPVASALQTDGGTFSRSIRQFYATGTAAEIVSSAKSGPSSPRRLSGEKKAMFFGTTTTFGAKVSFGSASVNGLVLGYRRKEISYIPVGTHGEADTYAPVIGMYSSGLEATTPDATRLGVQQYFATGAAAENIALWEETRAGFRSKGRDAFGEYFDSVAKQNSEAVLLYRCFANIPDARFGDVLGHADTLGLFHGKDALASIKAEKDARKARAAYIDELGIPVGKSDRAGRLLAHRVYVCDLAKGS